MKYKVLITAPYFQPVVQQFKNVFRQNGIEIVIHPVKERCSEEELMQYIEYIDGVIAGDDKFTERVLLKAKKLKVISKWGTGIDSINTEVCKRLGIAVRNTPNAFSDAVADTVMAYILCFARRVLESDEIMKKGIWYKVPCKAIHECTLGVIGVGNIGKKVVRRAICFGMKVFGNDIVEMPLDFLNETKILMVTKEELLQYSDFVSLNCDLNPTSYHLLGEKEFSIMKPTAVIINTSRGAVIKERALIKALEEKKIAGAGLDVFEDEPLSQDSPLMKMSNVLLAPHNANSSPEAWERVHQNTVKNLIEELRKNKE